MNHLCSVCSAKVESVFTLPNLPLTGIYAKETDVNFPAFDFEFFYCCQCGHAQGKSSINVEQVYDESYSFRTSTSESASGGVKFFKENLTRLFGNKKFKRIVDVGCNDGYLLKQLKGRGEQLYGIDMIWKNKEHEFVDDQITMFGDKVEDIPLWENTQGVPDLIVSQHTIEHIEDPKSLLSTLLKSVDSNTYFLFEFPSLNLLLENLRFDQIFHQHIQYFSVNSFTTLVNELGAEVLDVQFNQHYWGAVHILFKKSHAISSTSSSNTVPSLNDIQARYRLFKQQMFDCAQQLKWLYERGETIVGYGAALMLPVTFYHLSLEREVIPSVFDDDEQKNGLTYINLPISIKKPINEDFSTMTVLLAAIENRRPILKNLLQSKVKKIITPLNSM